MPEMIPFTDAQHVWSKGSTLWGEPLPYLTHTGEGKPFVAYGDWWTQKRVDLFSEWAAKAHLELHRLCGTDSNMRIYARARLIREHGERTGKPMTFAEVVAWRPAPEDHARIADIESTLIAGREEIRKSLMEAASHSSKVAADLAGEPSEWSPTQMAFAAMRITTLIRRLVAEGKLTNPGDTVPSHSRI